MPDTVEVERADCPCSLALIRGCFKEEVRFYPSFRAEVHLGRWKAEEGDVMERAAWNVPQDVWETV